MDVKEYIQKQIADQELINHESLSLFKIFADSIGTDEDWGYLKHPREIANDLYFWGTKILTEIDYQVVLANQLITFTQQKESINLIDLLALIKCCNNPKPFHNTPFTSVRELWNSHTAFELIKPFNDLLALIKTDCYSPEANFNLFKKLKKHNVEFYKLCCKFRESAMYLKGFNNIEGSSCQLSSKVEKFLLDAILENNDNWWSFDISQTEVINNSSSVGDKFTLHIDYSFA